VRQQLLVAVGKDANNVGPNEQPVHQVLDEPPQPSIAGNVIDGGAAVDRLEGALVMPTRI